MTYQLPELVQIDKHISGYVIRGYKAQHLLEAYAAGQRDMRERAAKRMKVWDKSFATGGAFASAIKALSIETLTTGETK